MMKKIEDAEKVADEIAGVGEENDNARILAHFRIPALT